MKKVIITSKGIPHFYATCYQCDWSYENHREREVGYTEIRKHVLNTGHEVHLEVGVHTNYALEKDTAEHGVHLTLGTLPAN